MDKKKTTRKHSSPPAEEEDNGVAGFLPDLLRRGLTLGFTGFFLTEEAVRKALGESVPRAEFLDRLSKEFAGALSSLDPVDLVKRLLEGRSIEVSARIRLVPSNAKTGGRGIKLSVNDAEEAE